jgi:hypothetical protein
MQQRRAKHNVCNREGSIYARAVDKPDNTAPWAAGFTASLKPPETAGIKNVGQGHNEPSGRRNVSRTDPRRKEQCFINQILGIEGDDYENVVI